MIISHEAAEIKVPDNLVTMQRCLYVNWLAPLFSDYVVHAQSSGAIFWRTMSYISMNK